MTIEFSHITIHRDLVQGSNEWLDARRGILTASEVCHVITPTLKVADNDKTRAHMYELLAQRISGFVEPTYIGEDMLRGQEDEAVARQVYDENFAPVTEVGFITNDKWGFTIGYSPDGLVGKRGAIEAKSRRQKYQVQTILNWKVPEEHIIQCQAGMLVAELEWLDYISYSGGLPMAVIRVWPDPKIQAAIINAAEKFEDRLTQMRGDYDLRMKRMADNLVPTVRREMLEIYA